MDDQPTETVFTNEAPAQTTVTETPAQEVKLEATSTEGQFATLLAGITADDGRQKYSDAEQAIASIPHSQQHIATLEEENAKLREEVTKRAAAEDILEQIKATNTQEVTPSEGLDLSQIESLMESKISNTLSAVEQQKVAKGNIDSVISALTDKFGEKAEEQFINAATASGLSVEQLNTLSATSPQAVLKLAGIDAGARVSPPPSQGSINTEALRPASEVPSARVGVGASTVDLVSAWRAAGES